MNIDLANRRLACPKLPIIILQDTAANIEWNSETNGCVHMAEMGKDQITLVKRTEA